jgi:hypothetical protein
MGNVNKVLVGETMTQCFVRAAKKLSYKDVVVHTLRHITV